MAASSCSCSTTCRPTSGARLAEAGARQFIQRYIGANDLAAVVYTGGSTDKGQEFTNSRARLLASVDKFIGNKLPSETMSKLDDYYRAQAARGASRRIRTWPSVATRRATRSSASNIVARIPVSVRGRRKAVVWFGEGIDYDIDNPFSPTPPFFTTR